MADFDSILRDILWDITEDVLLQAVADDPEASLIMGQMRSARQMVGAMAVADDGEDGDQVMLDRDEVDEVDEDDEVDEADGADDGADGADTDQMMGSAVGAPGTLYDRCPDELRALIWEMTTEESLVVDVKLSPVLGGGAYRVGNHQVQQDNLMRICQASRAAFVAGGAVAISGDESNNNPAIWIRPTKDVVYLDQSVVNTMLKGDGTEELISLKNWGAIQNVGIEWVVNNSWWDMNEVLACIMYKMPGLKTITVIVPTSHDAGRENPREETLTVRAKPATLTDLLGNLTLPTFNPWKPETTADEILAGLRERLESPAFWQTAAEYGDSKHPDDVERFARDEHDAPEVVGKLLHRRTWRY